VKLDPGRKNFGLLVGALLVGGGFTPIWAYWLTVGGVPHKSPEEVKALLSQPDHGAVLVDVRPASDFQARRIEGAESWPWESIIEAASTGSAPEKYQGKRLFLICESGISSAFAAKSLIVAGTPEVWNVEGGFQSWVGTARLPSPPEYARIKLASGETRSMPFREAPGLEQWAAISSSFGLLPACMLLGLLLVAVLWRARAPDLSALRWGLISFFAGKSLYAANFIALDSRSYLLGYLHAFGTVICFGLLSFAALEGADRRILKLSDPSGKCAAVGLCPRCSRQADVPCGLRSLSCFFLPALALLCFVPLGSDLSAVSYNTEILGSFRNDCYPVVQQVFDLRYCPAAAAVLFVIALLVLRWKRRAPVAASRILLAAGCGALGFCFLRLFLFGAYKERLVWFDFWEEATEFILVSGCGAVLWIFRRGLLGVKAGHGSHLR
jgi:rhodanese-related sulfurtransferase